MSLFPRFKGEPAAKVAKTASVQTHRRNGDANISNFSNFSSLGLALLFADLADAWHERMAICLEAGDISEPEAEITATIEVGRAFVRHFVTDRQHARGK